MAFLHLLLSFFILFFFTCFSFCIEYVLFREKIGQYTCKRDGGSDQCGVLQSKWGEKGIRQGGDGRSLKWVLEHDQDEVKSAQGACDGEGR